MSNGDMANWLAGSGLNHLSEVFAQNEIDSVDVARALTEEDIGELGLSAEDRAKVSKAVRALNGPDTNPVAEWLESKGLGKYANIFQENEFDTLEAVKQLKEADLKEMGIVAVGARRKVASAVEELKAEGRTAAEAAAPAPAPVPGSKVKYADPSDAPSAKRTKATATGASTKARLEDEVLRLKSALRTKTDARKEKRKVKISEVAATFVSAADSAPVHALMKAIGKFGDCVDIAFCMDGTGSMASHITAVKDNIVGISTDLIASSRLRARVAIVVYRDYCDGAARHEIYDFMAPEEVQDVLSRVRAAGGGDQAEDCIGGLFRCTELSWKAPARVCIWIADAPTHGSRFHDGCGDNYKGGDPDGRTPEAVLPVFVKMGIEIIFMRINAITDKMVRVFADVLGTYQRELPTYNMADRDGLRDLVTRSVTASVSRTSMRGVGGRSEKKDFTLISKYSWSPEDSCWGKREKAIVYKLEVYEGKDLDALIELLVDGPHVESKPAWLRITENPVFKGELRLAHPCLMEGDYRWSKETKLVAKESQYTASKYNTKSHHLSEAHIQLVARRFAKEWTAVCPSIPIEFIGVRVVDLQDRPKGNKYWTIEEFLPGTYHKWNNNNGFVSDVDAHPAMQAFSHWTYMRSKGLAMVVDIQGITRQEFVWSQGKVVTKYVLTDPAIHTGDPDKVMPHQTNLGRQGMAHFFATHHCNDICRKLGLVLPSDMPRATKEDAMAAAFADPADTVRSVHPVEP
eukprot:TRINITY_DN683_c0_g1_i2.p1 TRINITY_DN683_c0_g1~~TRINITY_DN683_c0_g1_i2.p1  ORF type:complete len:774 (+),score=196.54 TRINITY_DN683_c0_g1_i2:89-2323(+)